MRTNRFEWDEDKNQANYQKHGITFDEAIKIFKGHTWSRIDYGDYEEL